MHGGPTAERMRAVPTRFSLPRCCTAERSPGSTRGHGAIEAHGLPTAQRTRAFAHPHMGHLESSILIGWVLRLESGRSGGARSHTQRSAPPRSICVRTGFRRFMQLTASPHIRSGCFARTHIPRACGEEAKRMGPIYETAVLLAQGWHGHHPSRADRGKRCGAAALIDVYALTTAPSGRSPVVR